MHDGLYSNCIISPDEGREHERARALVRIDVTDKYDVEGMVVSSLLPCSLALASGL